MVQKEVDKYLEKESQLQQKIDEMDSFTFEFAKEVRDANRKRSAAHKHVKHFKLLAHRWINRLKELLKISNELGELNLEIYDEADYFIKAITSQEQILERYCLEISQSQSFSRDLKRKRAVIKQGGASQW